MRLSKTSALLALAAVGPAACLLTTDLSGLEGDPTDGGGDTAAFVARFTGPTNRWMHVVATWDEARREGALFLDAALVTRTPYAQAFAPSEQDFILGSTSSAGSTRSASTTGR